MSARFRRIAEVLEAREKCPVMATIQAPRVEWVDARAAQQQFGLSKTVLYHLRLSGRVVSSSVQVPGKSRGKRLYLVASLRGVIDAGVGK